LELDVLRGRAHARGGEEEARDQRRCDGALHEDLPFWMATRAERAPDAPGGAMLYHEMGGQERRRMVLEARAVTVAEVQKQFLHGLNLRIGPETAAYVLRRIDANASAPAFAVMGGNARTGVPVRLLVKPSELAAGLASPLPPTDY
jgi:hypothetical protein